MQGSYRKLRSLIGLGKWLHTRLWISISGFESLGGSQNILIKLASIKQNIPKCPCGGKMCGDPSRRVESKAPVPNNGFSAGDA